MLFKTAVAHPTAMMRVSFVRHHGLKYDPEYLHAEDYELWNRCSQLFSVANIPQVLLKYRIHKGGISKRQQSAQNETVLKIHKKNFQSLGLDHDDRACQVHFLVSFPKYPQEKSFVKEAEEWLLKIYEANKASKFYESVALQNLIGERWLGVCAVTQMNLFHVWRVFRRSEINRLYSFSLKQRMKLVIFHLVRRTDLTNKLIHILNI
jgi:hypothetical protein